MTDSEEADTIEVSVEGEMSLFALKMLTEMCDEAGNISMIDVTVRSEDGFDLDDAPSYFFDEVEDVSFKGVSFSEGSRAEKLTSVLCEKERKWRNSGQIRRDLLPETGISKDDLSQVLWDLSERGILEKQPCESDGRMKQYRLTEFGRKSYLDHIAN